MKEENDWNPDSWKSFKTSQQPEYKDHLALESVQNKVKQVLVKMR